MSLLTLFCAASPPSKSGLFSMELAPFGWILFETTVSLLFLYLFSYGIEEFLVKALIWLEEPVSVNPISLDESLRAIVNTSYEFLETSMNYDYWLSSLESNISLYFYIF